MSYRRSKDDGQRRVNDWRNWNDERRADLIALGLPAEVYLNESHWSDFLQNGHLHWHETSGFEFGALSTGQSAALLRFLEREYGGDERLPLLTWLRVRAEKHAEA